MKYHSIRYLFLLACVALCLFVAGHAHARAKEQPKTSTPPLVTKWIDAMMHEGKGVNGLITSDFQYTGYSFDYKDRLKKGKKGAIPFFAKKAPPTDITLDSIEDAPGGGQVATLTAVAETSATRSWDIRLLIRDGGIAKVSEIAREGMIEGFPPGCPETALKRDLVVTLHGTPEGFSAPKDIKLYSFRRDTDTWEFARPGVDENMLKYCSPRPDTYLIESEVVVFDENGQLEAANTVAAKHKAEEKEAAGATFFEEDGVNYPGRIFNMGGGKGGLLLTFTIEEDRGNRTQKTSPAKLYVWKGSGWKSVWDFDAEFSSAEGFAGGVSNSVVWSLKSATDASGSPAITARLETNGDESLKCPRGTSITFARSGSGFKPVKGDAPSACFKKHSVSDGSLRSNLAEDKGSTYHGEVKEIDWIFQK